MLVATVLSFASFLAPLPAIEFSAQNKGSTQEEKLPGARTPEPTMETRQHQRAELEKKLKLPAPNAWTKTNAAPLARKALEAALGTLPSSDTRYAALDLTRELAEAAVDVELGFKAIELLEAEWDLDSRPLRRKFVLKTAAKAEGDQRKTVATRALELAREYVELAEYELATELIDDRDIKILVYEDDKLSKERSALEGPEIDEYRAVRNCFKALADSSPKPEDYHRAGYYLCFRRGIFERGLPLLTKGDFPAFAELATRDLKAPTDPLQQLELAQGWLKVARIDIRKKDDRTLALRRAQHWLTAAKRGSGITTAERETMERLETDIDAALASATEAAARVSRPKQVEPEARAPRKTGGRLDARSGKRNLKARGGSGVELALKDGLEWLKWHQSAEGSWRAKHYSENCGKIAEGAKCEGAGEAQFDIGLTGLALLAFLGDGDTTSEGPYRDNVDRGIKWLIDQQDPESGLIGPRKGAGFIYNHAVATQALCEAYYFSESPSQFVSAQRAVDFILSARNPYGAWRYQQPPTGENDTSVTGWMVMALKAAEEAGLQVDRESFSGAITWIDEVTDTKTGRVGYDAVGSPSTRNGRVNGHFIKTRGEAMTAEGLLCRIFLGQEPKKTPVMGLHADLLLKKLPVWDSDPKQEAGTDFYYWYYGSNAMYQMGGEYWVKWEKSMTPALVNSQRKDGDAKGSWNPEVDPWGYAGGRVYTTAMAVLTLEVYFRYARVLGGR